ncbi:hypothetical protein [Amycolatopsis sp.]|uniref:hypothetical protein n=1 Tax=Amycolatopsis sp. TaxID=37632 RepID=UPI002C09B9E3|nr:hypothetical protein [Amycolatopsis sp.]HVV08954.1 hypothetical protein [Amycolatopsis sp.]
MSEGGDPVCWLNRVCPECGRFREDEDATHCPGCGIPVAEPESRQGAFGER